MRWPYGMVAGGIDAVGGTVIAISKHIEAGEALAGAGVSIRVDEPTNCRVIVAGLEVVEAAFVIVVVTAIAQGVPVGDVGGVGHCLERSTDSALDCHRPTVGVIGICRYLVAAGA